MLSRTLLATFLLLLFAQHTIAQYVVPSHGTINVILAYEDTLVAVTDSMLSAGDIHNPTGVKLFKIDDVTICTLAGFYSEPGPSESGSLTAMVPQIMGVFQDRRRQSGAEQEPFAEKALELSDLFSHRLTSHLQAVLAANPQFDISNPNLTIELTLAGYDRGSLKVADITLGPERSDTGVQFVSVERKHGPITPLCELTAESDVSPLPTRPPELGVTPPTVRKVGKRFFCDISGVPDVAELALDRPYRFKDSAILQAYSRAREAGTELSPNELRALAIELERQTELRERNSKFLRVGGAPQVAVLSSGRMTESPAPALPYEVGEGLSGPHVYNSEYTCQAPGIPLEYMKVDGGVNAQMQVDLTNCRQGIDGILFHNSKFINNVIFYLGREPLIFDDNNVVTGSTLELGPNVNLRSPNVNHLVCGFPWKTVYRGSSELKLSCPQAPAK